MGMVITRTPYRISFFGGGTDYASWYEQHGSTVLATTFNRYCTISCRYLPPFFEHRDRIVWSKIEQVVARHDIEHPAVRAALQYLDIKHGVEIQHQGDLPARSGLGSSSAFTVGLLHALYALLGMTSTKRHLACEAVHIERDILKENVGVQDQIQTAFGGLNKIVVHTNGDFQVTPLSLPVPRMNALQSHLLLFFTGIVRNATDIASSKIKAIPKKQYELSMMQAMVDEAINVLCTQQDLAEFGKLLHDSWLLKQSLSSNIAPSFIQDIYEKARKAGAIGGKLLGAGGGGFMLIFAKPEDHPAILNALSDLLLVPFEFERAGSQIIYHDHTAYSHAELTRKDYIHLQKNTDDTSSEINLNELSRNRKNSLSTESVTQE